MQADWSVACGADDPVLVVPWGGEISDVSNNKPIQYIDLRAAPDTIQEIQETIQYPILAKALRRWNQPGTQLFTAKCDVWNYPARLFDAEDLPDFSYAHASYVDLLPIEPAMFSSFAACERQLRTWTEIAQLIPLPAARCEWTLRPARILSASAVLSGTSDATSISLNGFSTSLYVWGYGPSPESAASIWATALERLIEPVLLLSQS